MQSGEFGREDLLHDSGGEPWWFESYWFSFFIPERRLMVYIYPWFRPTLGICGGGVVAWDDSAHESWNIVHCDYNWHLPCPTAKELITGATLEFPQKVQIEVLKPLMHYRIGYQSDALEVAVEFMATQDPNIHSKAVGSAALYAGRLDQCGHVSGHITLHGETIPVDCMSMRDRSWGVRRDDSYKMHIGYFHATATKERAFLVVSDPSAVAANDCAPVVSGYLMEEGVSSPLNEGSTIITRAADGTPVACEIKAQDMLGRGLIARGDAISHFAYQPFPGMFNWSSLANWQFNGIECVGELQETWHPDLWRRFYQSRQPH